MHHAFVGIGVSQSILCLSNDTYHGLLPIASKMILHVASSESQFDRRTHCITLRHMLVPMHLLQVP
jgi:hypothetical protein